MSPELFHVIKLKLHISLLVLNSRKCKENMLWRGWAKCASCVGFVLPTGWKGGNELNSYFWSTCQVPVPATWSIQVLHTSHVRWSCWHEDASKGCNFYMFLVKAWFPKAAICGTCQFFPRVLSTNLSTSPAPQTQGERNRGCGGGWEPGLIILIIWAVLHSILCIGLLSYLFLAPCQQSTWMWHEKQILINSLNNW